MKQFLSIKILYVTAALLAFFAYHQTILNSIIEFVVSGRVPLSNVVLEPEMVLLVVVGTITVIGLYVMTQVIYDLLENDQMYTSDDINTKLTTSPSPVVKLRVKTKMMWLNFCEQIDEVSMIVGSKARNMVAPYTDVVKNLGMGIAVLFLIGMFRFKSFLIRFCRDEWIIWQPRLRKFDAWLESRIKSSTKSGQKMIDRSEALSVFFGGMAALFVNVRSGDHAEIRDRS